MLADPVDAARRGAHAPAFEPRMKILYLTPGCFDKGGISRYSRYQISALREIVGARNVHALSLLGPDEDSLEEHFEVEFHASGNSRKDKAALMLRAVALAARVRPDVIHAAHVHLSSAALVLAAATGARAVLNVYGLEVWSGLRGDAALGLRAMRHVIADCHFTARYVKHHGLGGGAQLGVIWDCVDVAKLSPGVTRPAVLARYGIPDPATGLNLLTLGRLSSEGAHKGYDRLLDVFARVSATVPELRLVYAGRGGLAAALRERAERMGLGARVTFTGSVHEDDLVDVYRSGHIFSLVSDRGHLRGEGLPLTPLEAAACGVPLLVGDQDGSQEAVVDGQNGFVVDPFDLDAHADRIIKLARSPALRASMGAAARARAVNEFSYTRFVAEHRATFTRWFGDLDDGHRAANASPPRSN
jgi:phosphatidylinositol alpha-1,6-mannosyltransferase